MQMTWNVDQLLNCFIEGVGRGVWKIFNVSTIWSGIVIRLWWRRMGDLYYLSIRRCLLLWWFAQWLTGQNEELHYWLLHVLQYECFTLYHILCTIIESHNTILCKVFSVEDATKADLDKVQRKRALNETLLYANPLKYSPPPPMETLICQPLEVEQSFRAMLQFFHQLALAGTFRE